MNSNLTVIPTGDEIINGTVLDTDSPEIKRLWNCTFPYAEVTLHEPVSDDVEIITANLLESSRETDIIVMIGGSGGGHRHVSSLGKDFTHTVMDKLLKHAESKSIYGGNGHLWCRLVIGFCNNTLVVNIPGPFSEATAAFAAFCAVCAERGIPQKKDVETLKLINHRMSEAVIRTYD